MQNHICGNYGAIEDEGGDMDEPFPRFESLPADTERQVDCHGKSGAASEEDEEREDFFERHNGLFPVFID